jgi:hypothetical protein
VVDKRDAHGSGRPRLIGAGATPAAVAPPPDASGVGRSSVLEQ